MIQLVGKIYAFLKIIVKLSLNILKGKFYMVTFIEIFLFGQTSLTLKLLSEMLCILITDLWVIYGLGIDRCVPKFTEHKVCVVLILISVSLSA